MRELVLSIQEFLKIVPGLVIFPLSFYLAWKKLGTKVVASPTFGFDRTTAYRITHVDLSNLKDRPMAIHSMHAVVNNEISYEIDKFEPPLILKALESLRIETRPYSRLWLGSEKYKPDFVLPNRIDIYLVLSDRMIKCEPGSHPSLLPFKTLNKYQRANKETERFNNVVYNEHAAYAITYSQQGQVKTAIIDRSGFISQEWNFEFNMIPPVSMKSKDHIKRLLEESPFGKLVKHFTVDDLHKAQQNPPADVSTSAAIPSLSSQD